MRIKLMAAAAAAGLLALAWGAPAAATNIIYTFHGLASGFVAVDSPDLTPFSALATFKIDGELPGAPFGPDNLVPIEGMKAGALTFDLPAGTVAYFGPSVAGLGSLIPSPHGIFDFEGASLLGYDGTHAFGPVPVTFVGADNPLFAQLGGHNYTLFIDSIGNADHPATFSAATVGVPEPAAWALMVLGFGGLGAALRRRRVA
jgi:hypothetical protein